MQHNGISLARLYREEVIHFLVRPVPFTSSFTTVGEDLNWPTLVPLIEVVFGTPSGIHKKMSKNAEVVCLMLVHFRMVYRRIFFVFSRSPVNHLRVSARVDVWRLATKFMMSWED